MIVSIQYLKVTHVFESLLKLCQHIPEEHVVLVHLPDVALLIRQYSKKEFPVAVGDVGLGDDDVVAGGEGEEGHHLAGDGVVRHVQRLLYRFCCFYRLLYVLDWRSFCSQVNYSDSSREEVGCKRI